MQDMKRTVAHNISALRRAHGMTQLQLAERLNYSDKAISKWERGDSLPDIVMLKTIADLFGVTVDYLITENHPEDEAIPTEEATAKTTAAELRHRRHTLITSMSILLVWLIATVLFVILFLSLEAYSVNPTDIQTKSFVGSRLKHSLKRMFRKFYQSHGTTERESDDND